MRTWCGLGASNSVRALLLYTSGDCRRLLVNLSLTLSSAFPLLKDLRRKRLSGGLMPLKPAPTPDKYEEKTNGTPSGQPAPRLFRLSAGVNL